MKHILTVEAFAEWAEKQPANKEYDYWSVSRCACAQYARALGIKFWRVFPESSFWIGINIIASEEPHTFGALAGRLREEAGQ